MKPPRSASRRAVSPPACRGRPVRSSSERRAVAHAVAARVLVAGELEIPEEFPCGGPAAVEQLLALFEGVEIGRADRARVDRAGALGGGLGQEALVPGVRRSPRDRAPSRPATPVWPQVPTRARHGSRRSPGVGRERFSCLLSNSPKGKLDCAAVDDRDGRPCSSIRCAGSTRKGIEMLMRTAWATLNWSDRSARVAEQPVFGQVVGQIEHAPVGDVGRHHAQPVGVLGLGSVHGLGRNERAEREEVELLVEPSSGSARPV